MRDKCRLIPPVLGAEFLQSSSGLSCSWRSLVCCLLWLIKGASWWLCYPWQSICTDWRRHVEAFVFWSFFLICLTCQVKPLHDHSNAAQRRISPTSFSLDPEARWWRFLRGDIGMQHTLPLWKHDDRKSHWSRQHGRLSSSWQRAQYSKHGTPAVRRAAESQEEAFHLIGSKTKLWPSVELQPYIFPKKKRQTRGGISVFISNT